MPLALNIYKKDDVFMFAPDGVVNSFLVCFYKRLIHTGLKIKMKKEFKLYFKIEPIL